MDASRVPMYGPKLVAQAAGPSINGGSSVDITTTNADSYAVFAAYMQSVRSVSSKSWCIVRICFRSEFRQISCDGFSIPNIPACQICQSCQRLLVVLYPTWTCHLDSKSFGIITRRAPRYTDTAVSHPYITLLTECSNTRQNQLRSKSYTWSERKRCHR
jgi:hypothetical protein